MGLVKNNYDRRWDFVYNWAKNVQDFLAQGYKLYDGYQQFSQDEFIIDEVNRYLGLKKGNCQFMLYEGNLEFDHGAYTPIAKLKEELSEYSLLKPMDIDLFNKE
jgi:hypothetical protein